MGTKPVILAVDDTEELLLLMGRALAEEYEFLGAKDAGTAIEMAGGSPRPDLILLDIDMPGVSGFEVCQALKGEPLTAGIPVVFLTAREGAEAQIEGLGLGAVDYVMKPINSAVLKARLRMHLAFSRHQEELERMVRERTAQLESSRVELIKRLGRAMELHESAASGNRVMRLANYAKLLAQASGAKQEVCDLMMKAAPLHDIGKLGVPTDILRKKDKLSAPDWERVKRHPQLGADIIGEHDDPLLKLARQLALTHHEHWDGTGYPQGLKGNAIPWPGRVMAIVDAFEAMTTTQFHREAVTIEKAAADIYAGSGKKYDPMLVDAFQKALPVMRKVREAYSDALGDMINLDFAAKAKPAEDKTAQSVKAAARSDARRK